MLMYVVCTDHNDYFSASAGGHAARLITRGSSLRMDAVCSATTVGHDSLAASSLDLEISIARGGNLGVERLGIGSHLYC